MSVGGDDDPHHVCDILSQSISHILDIWVSFQATSNMEKKAHFLPSSNLSNVAAVSNPYFSDFQ